MDRPDQALSIPKGHKEGRGPSEGDRDNASTPTPSHRPHFTTPRDSTPRGTTGARAGPGRVAREHDERSGRVMRGSNLPVSASTSALGRGGRVPAMQSTSQQSGIPSPARMTYQQRPSGSTSSRRLSASFRTGNLPSSQSTTGYSSATASTAAANPRAPRGNRPHPGPLTSHPTTASSSMAASGSRGNFDRHTPGALRLSQTSSTPAGPSSTPRENKRSSLIPIPKSTTLPEFVLNAPVNPTAFGDFKQENIPPSNSPGDIGTRHRDSLQIRSTQNIPRRTLPGAKPREVTNLPSTAEHPATEEQMPTDAKGKGALREQPAQPAQPQPQPQAPPRTHLPQLPAPKPQSKKPSGIPKSRTFNAFSGLAASFSRTSLSNFVRNPSGSSMASKKGDDASKPGGEGSSSSAAAGPQATREASRIPTSASTSAFASSGAPFRNPRLVYEAQSIIYWTGRFIALHDKLKNEMLLPENLSAIVDTYTSRVDQVPVPSGASTSASGAGLPTSNTIAAMPSTSTFTSAQPRPAQQTQPIPLAQAVEQRARAAILTDDDRRTRRVFIQLEAMCATREALESMQAFQQEYARRTKKAFLLPPGGTMEDGTKAKGSWVSRVFSGGKEKDKEGQKK